MLLKGVVALAVAVAFDLAFAVAATHTFQIFDVYIYIYIDMYIYTYVYIYIFIDTCYFVSCFSVIQQMPLGDIPVTIWLDALIFSRSFATIVCRCGGSLSLRQNFTGHIVLSATSILCQAVYIAATGA